MPRRARPRGKEPSETRANWQAKVKGLLKGELKKRNLSYADLAEKLVRLAPSP